MKRLLFLVLALLFAPGRDATAAPERPNVLFLLADDQGYGHLAEGATTLALQALTMPGAQALDLNRCA